MKQEKLNEKLKSVIRQAREIGIPVPDNISENVVINPRPRKRFGCCRRQADKFQIEVSSFVLDCLDDKIAGVLAHEILDHHPINDARRAAGKLPANGI